MLTKECIVQRKKERKEKKARKKAKREKKEREEKERGKVSQVQALVRPTYCAIEACDF
jgi:hypothetical protein